MSLIYSMLMSVDGYVEHEHGRFGFAQPDEKVYAYINQAGGPSFHVPFFFPALMLRVPVLAFCARAGTMLPIG
jgi:hypothetical protein